MQCYNFPSMDLLIQIYYKLRSTNKQQQEMGNGDVSCGANDVLFSLLKQLLRGKEL